MKVFVYDKKDSKRIAVIENVHLVTVKGYTITFHTALSHKEFDTRKVKTSTFQN